MTIKKMLTCVPNRDGRVRRDLTSARIHGEYHRQANHLLDSETIAQPANRFAARV
jgi:hypothetical protein